jgi:molybdopterin-guanine dinucleotide biosynthesis protein A
VEPLCAWYGISCIGAIEQAAARGDARMIGFHDQLRVHRLPLAAVRTFGDPEQLFANLNTPADLAALERMLAEQAP